MRNLIGGAPLAMVLLMAFAPGGAVAELQTLTPVPERPPAPDFVLQDAEGNSHRLSDYRGKVVALNFWASWCPPCWREMPSMQRLKERMDPEEFVILAVNIGEDDETVFGFIFSLDVTIDFPLLLDQDGAVSEQWPIVGLPTTFVLDGEGRVVFRAIGGRLWDAPEITTVFEELAAQ